MLREKLKLCVQRGIFSCSFCSMVWEQLYCFFIMEGHHPPSMQCLPAPAAFLRLCVSASLDKLSAVVDCSLVDCCGLLCTLVDRCGLLWTVVHPCEPFNETQRDSQRLQAFTDTQRVTGD